MILGIAVVSKIAIADYKRIALWLLAGAFILPFSYATIMFWPPFENGDILVAIPIIIIAMVSASIPTLLITGAMNLLRLLTKK